MCVSLRVCMLQAHYPKSIYMHVYIHTCMHIISGQLGHGDQSDQQEACRISSVKFGTPCASVSCGEEYTIIVTADRAVYACGLNNVGQVRVCVCMYMCMYVCVCICKYIYVQRYGVCMGYFVRMLF